MAALGRGPGCLSRSGAPRAAAAARCVRGLLRGSRGPPRLCPAPAALSSQGKEAGAPAPTPLAPLVLGTKSAVKTSMKGQLMCHNGEGGRFLVPLLDPETQEVPFGMALELLEPEYTACMPHDVNTRGVQLYELLYVLEGEGQIISQDGTQEILRAGDSALMPVGHGCTVSASNSGDDVSDPPQEGSLLKDGRWGMATLRMLLPADLIFYPSTAGREARTAVTSAFQGWMDGMHEGSTITDELVDNLLASARERALASIEGEDHRADHSTAAEAASHVHDDSAEPSTSSKESAADDVPPPLLVVDGVPLPVRMRAWTAGARDRSAEAGPSSSAARLSHAPPPWVNAARDATMRALQGLLPLPGLGLIVPLAQKTIAAGSKARRVVKRRLSEVAEEQMYQLPEQSNRLALFYDPTQADVPFTFGIEIFNPAHVTPPHVHTHAYELFFILSGEGEGVCDGATFNVSVGDTIVFPPLSEHGINNAPGAKMYCLEMMLPNEMFAEFVRRGRRLHGLESDDLCVLIAQGCR